MLRVSLHTSSKYEFICIAVSSGEIIRAIADSHTQPIRVTASVPETSVSSRKGTVFHTFNPRGSRPFPESATCTSNKSLTEQDNRQFFCKLKILNYKPELLESSPTQTAM